MRLKSSLTRSIPVPLHGVVKFVSDALVGASPYAEGSLGHGQYAHFVTLRTVRDAAAPPHARVGLTQAVVPCLQHKHRCQEGNQDEESTADDHR